MERQIFILILLFGIAYLLIDDFFGEKQHLSKFALRVLGGVTK